MEPNQTQRLNFPTFIGTISPQNIYKGIGSYFLLADIKKTYFVTDISLDKNGKGLGFPWILYCSICSGIELQGSLVAISLIYWIIILDSLLVDVA